MTFYVNEKSLGGAAGGDAVTLGGTQTITGDKTFQGDVKVPTVTEDVNDNTAASCAWVMNKLSQSIFPLQSITNKKSTYVRQADGSWRAGFNWQDPTDVMIGGYTTTKWGKTVIVKKKEGYPTSPNDGEVVLTNTERNKYATEKFVDSHPDYYDYYYKAFPYSTAGIYFANADNEFTRLPDQIPPKDPEAAGIVTRFNPTQDSSTIQIYEIPLGYTKFSVTAAGAQITLNYGSKSLLGSIVTTTLTVSADRLYIHVGSRVSTGDSSISTTTRNARISDIRLTADASSRIIIADGLETNFVDTHSKADASYCTGTSINQGKQSGSGYVEITPIS